MPNLLIDKLPTTVFINGAEYPIYSDFRTGIKFEVLMNDDTLNEEEAVVKSLVLYYGEGILSEIESVQDAINQMIWFYNGGKEEMKKSSGASTSAKQAYSYEYDNECIYSAFLQIYHIDLQNTEYMHWWKFKALFKTLITDDRLSQIIEYRVTDINKLPKEQRKFYQSMQHFYELPIPKQEQRQKTALEEALLLGLPIDGLL